MRFTKLQLENWRNFTHVDVALQNRMFLIGANATGKSNLLDVFRFLRDIVHVGGGFEKAVADRGEVNSLRNIFANTSDNIVMDVSLGDDEREAWRYRLAIGQDAESRPILREERVWKAGMLLLERPNKQDSDDMELLHQTHLEQTSSNGAFRDIAKFFDSIRYYHIVPQLVREPERSKGRTSDPYGSDFLAQVANVPQKERDSRLRRIQHVLKVAVPQLQQLRIEEDRRGDAHLSGRFGDLPLENAWQTETHFSDGTLRLIGLLWALLDEGGPLLLEEPELSLHPEIVRHIPALMATIQKEHSRQILVSTHSDALLRDESIALDEVLILRPGNSGTTVDLGKDIAIVKQLVEAGLSIAEAALPITQPEDAYKLSFPGEP
ncbi:MAG TPA: AAA family ATPase [Ktedonobacteraceae bacterium]|nr:AAA family ATPase [Ktedonobacteraceae bacterium]